jgi:nucleoside-diphosphate-sugar epimerase
MTSDQVLSVVIGTGDLGRRVANSLNQKQHEVLTLSRRLENPAHTGRHISANAVTGEGLLALPNQAKTLVYCLAPDERNEAAYRDTYLHGLQRVLAICRPERLIFIGSTAVFAQDAGQWVNETSPALAETFNGRVLRECEAFCQQYGNASVLRLSGIYGPGRESMIRRAHAGDMGRAHWTNRIHVDDAASAVVHITNLETCAARYCVSDDLPVREDNLLTWLRGHEKTAETESDAKTTGRRVSNQLLRSTGWQANYPSYQNGYRQLFNVKSV